jgi:hypothetical protein
MRELEGRGYVLKTVRRCTPAMRRARFDEARRIMQRGFIRKYGVRDDERKVSV